MSDAARRGLGSVVWASRIARLDRWVHAPADWLTIGGAWAAAALVVLAPLFLLPGLYLSAMPHDSLSMADIGYRMAAGQTPGRDFHSAFGVLFQAQMGLGMRLGGTVAGCLKIATAAFVLVAGGFAAYVARRRLSNLGAAAAVFSLMLLGAAPYARADAAISGVTFAMIYNREAWSVLTIAALFWLSPRRGPRPRLDAAVLGLLVAACLYMKVSYGGLALIFAAAWLMARERRLDAAGVLASVLLACAAAVEVIFGPGFNLAYLRDILLVAAAGGGRIAHIVFTLLDARYELVVVCVFVPLILAATGVFRRDTYLFALATAGAAVLVVWQNAQVEGLVLLWAGLAAMLEPQLADPVDAGSPSRPPFARLATVIYAAWTALVVGPSAVAMLLYMYGAASVPAQDPAIPMIADVRFQPGKPQARTPGVIDGDLYAAALSDGVGLLAACPAGAKVYTLDLFEPFTMLTRRPPNAAWTWHDPGHSFTDRVHPTAAAELGDVGCVMIPRQPIKPASTRGLLSLYGPYIDANFPAVRTSADWTLRMRAAAAPTPGRGG